MENLTIIIPYYNGDSYIHNLINTIPDTIPVVIADDLSDTKLNINKPNVTVYRLQEKRYFAGAVNFGIQQCKTDVLILNQDVLLSNGWQKVIEDNRHEYAMIGERIKGTHPLIPRGYIHGTFAFFRRDLIDDIGLLNEELYPLWGNTALYQLQASRKGYKVLPLETVPGFTHLRHEKQAFGSSIKATINNTNKAKLIQTPPLISIIIPCHNYAHYLQDSVNSLIGGDTCLGKLPGQTFQSFEVIIVDDGSNKENQEQINQYVTGWNGVRVIRLNRNPIDQNGKYIGKPSALNAGINKAIGKYITVLDADDMMDSRRLQVLYHLAEQNPNSVVYDQIISFKKVEHKIKWHNEKTPDNIKEIDTSQLSLERETTQLTKLACQHGNVTIYGNNLAFYFWPLPSYNFDHMLHKNCMHAGILFTKKAWQDVGGYNEQMIYGREDWAMNIALGEKGYCGIRASQPYYLYRREGQNRTLENTKPNWQKRFQQQIRDIYPHLYRGERPMACCGGRSTNKQQLNGGSSLKTLNLSQQDGLTYVKYVGSRSASFSIWGPVTGVQYRVNPKNPVFLVDNNDLHTKQGTKLTGILDVYEGTKFAFEIYTQPEPVKIETQTVEEVLPSIQDTFDTFDLNGSEEVAIEGKPTIRYDLIDSVLESDLQTASNLIIDAGFSEYELHELATRAKNKQVSKLLINRINQEIARFDGNEAAEQVDISRGVLQPKHYEALETVTKLRNFMLNETFSLAELELMLEYEKANKNRISAIDMINLNIDIYDGSTLVHSSDIQNY